MSSAMEGKNPPFSHLVTLFFLLYLLLTSATSEGNLTTDQNALLALKDCINSDPYGVLKNWSISSSVCNWIGVTCGMRHHRVTELNISFMGLGGSIPPEFGNLSFLVSIDIKSNSFSGTLPEQLAHLRRLKYIRLSFNNFSGGIPLWFSSFPQLHYLSLTSNSFTGGLNLFISSLTNVSKLDTLFLSYNSLGGIIPKAIESLQNLKTLNMQSNKLTGSIPLGIFNISTLELLDLSSNILSGILPDDLCFRLPMVKNLYRFYTAGDIQHLYTRIDRFIEQYIIWDSSE